MISACIIAKNEEKNIPRLLRSLRGKFKEIILVDTGSEDRTIDIAKDYGCNVVEHKWNGFADARNRAIKEATGDWIWHFDADFEIDEKEFEKAKRQLLLLDKRYKSVNVIIENYNIDGSIRCFSSHTFIHRNLPEIKWKGKVHEYLENAEFSFGMDVRVKHFGYEDNTVLLEKAKRNAELLEKEIDELEKEGKRNSDYYAYKCFYLVQSYSVLSFKEKNNRDKIFEYIEKYFEIRKSPKSYNIFDVHIYTYYMEALLKEENYDKLKSVLTEALTLNKNYTDFLYLKALYEHKVKNYEDAFNYYFEFLASIDKSLRKNPFNVSGSSTFLSDKSIYSYKVADIIIPEIYEKLRKKEEFLNMAQTFWKERKGLYTGIAFARILELEKRDKDAFGIFKKLLRIYNTNYLAFFEAGKYFTESGDYESALRCFKKSLVLNANYLYSKVYVGYIELLKGENPSYLFELISFLKEKFENEKDENAAYLLYKSLDILKEKRGKKNLSSSDKER